MQARDASPPVREHVAVYIREGRTHDRLSVITVTAAAPLLSPGGGKRTLEPQEQH